MQERAPAPLTPPEKAVAKLLAPLLSFSASGKLANSIVAFSWHGINCLRSYVIPHNPRTPEQQANRQHIKIATFAWKNYLLAPLAREGWTNWATIDERPLTGYNAAVSNMTIAHRILGAVNFGNGSIWLDNQTLRIYLFNGQTGQPLNEGVTYTIYYGALPETLDQTVSVPQTVAGYIDLAFGVPQLAIVYFNLYNTVYRNGREPTAIPPP